MDKKLYRSSTNAMLGGVCGGLGEYLGIEPTLVRLLFVLLALSSGAGVLLYLAMWLIVPLEGSTTGTTWQQTLRQGTQEMADKARALGEELRKTTHNQSPSQASLVVGGLLVALGVVFLLQNLNLPGLWWFNMGMLWPLLLVVGGIALLLRRSKEK
jgi:phage shock protein C